MASAGHLSVESSLIVPGRKTDMKSSRKKKNMSTSTDGGGLVLCDPGADEAEL